MDQIRLRRVLNQTIINAILHKHLTVELLHVRRGSDMYCCKGIIAALQENVLIASIICADLDRIVGCIPCQGCKSIEWTSHERHTFIDWE